MDGLQKLVKSFSKLEEEITIKLSPLDADEISCSICESKDNHGIVIEGFANDRELKKRLEELKKQGLPTVITNEIRH